MGINGNNYRADTADTRARIVRFVLVLQLYPWPYSLLSPYSLFAQKLSSLNWIECQTSTRIITMIMTMMMQSALECKLFRQLFFPLAIWQMDSTNNALDYDPPALGTRIGSRKCGRTVLACQSDINQNHIFSPIVCCRDMSEKGIKTITDKRIRNGVEAPGTDAIKFGTKTPSWKPLSTH